MSILRSKWRDLLPVAIAAVVLVLDQASKAAVMRYLEPGIPWSPIEPLRRVFSLTYVTNTGAAFGIFPQLGNYYVFIVLAIVVALFVFYRRFASSHWLMTICLGLQVGGALGNLVDRLRLGHVVDFLDFKVWPVFNVADSCVVIGVAVLAYLILRESPEENAQSKPAGLPEQGQ